MRQTRNLAQTVDFLHARATAGPSAQTGGGNTAPSDHKPPAQQTIKSRPPRKQPNPQRINPPNFRLISHATRTVPHYRLQFSTSQFTITLANEHNFEDQLLSLARKSMENALAEVRRKGCVPVLGGMKISSANLPRDICVSWIPIDQLQIEELVARFSKYQQSGSTDNLLGRSFTLSIDIQFDRSARGKNTSQPCSGETSNGLFPNHSSDGECLFRATVISLLSLSNHPQQVAQPRRLACQLANAPTDSIVYRRHVAPLVRGFQSKTGDWPLHQFAAGIEEKLNSAYPKLAPFRLVVVGSPSFRDLWLYPPINKKYEIVPKTNLVLLYDKGHYTTIWNPRKYFKASNFCFDCRKTIDSFLRHSSLCPVKCKFCGCRSSTVPCPEDPNSETHVSCLLCNTSFKNPKCFENHKNTTCAHYKTCLSCLSRYSVRKGHECGFRYCARCRVVHSTARGCFMTKLPAPLASPSYKLITYDYETRQEPLDPNDTRKIPDSAHVVNFAAARVTCNHCMDSGTWKDQGCVFCLNHREYWSEPEGIMDPAAAFLEFVVEQAKGCPLAVCLAHYSGRFDMQLTMAAIYKRNDAQKIEITAAGNRIFRMSIYGGSEFKEIRFLDSYNFIPMGLDKIPKALSLPQEIQERGKGFFPHAYNRRENYHLAPGPYPPPSDFYAESFLIPKRKEFDSWYAGVKDQRNFQLVEQLRKYGRNDVDLLTEAVVKYRALVRQISANEFDDIFFSCTTLAGSTMRDIRMNHLEAQTIPIIPNGGYSRNETQSRFALRFLKWLAHSRKLQIQHRDNEGEKWIARSNGKWCRVDGYVHAEKRIFEILGCYWHGCPKCSRMPDQTQPNRKTPQELFKQTVERLAELRALGYIVEEHWECEIRRKLRADQKMKTFFDYCPDTENLRFTDGFHGGRTQPFALHASVKSGSKGAIFYADIQSLYPAVLFDEEYPTGIPRREKFEPKRVQWTRPEHLPAKGIWKVRVHPPKHLFPAVLPLKVGKSLLFPLCRTCALDNVEGRKCKKVICKHTALQRSFISTCTHLELRKALSKGYTVDQLFESYTWPETAWSRTLFRDYIGKNLKVKIEASGPPANMTAEEKVEFLKQIRERYGFELNETNWLPNEGLRTIAKLRLNSSWGKFAQRDDLEKTKICRNSEELDALFADPGVKVKSISAVNDNTLFVQYKMREHYVVENSFSNVCIAIFTTSAARLRLYAFMEECIASGGKILYSDTDSLIMQSANQQCPITLGTHLGEMQLEKPGFAILEFVCAGPKQYGLCLLNLETGEITFELKLRGFTLDERTSATLNYAAFRRLVLENAEIREGITVAYSRLQPNLHGGVQTRLQNKLYEPVLNKGIFLPDDPNTIYPFGYISGGPIQYGPAP